MMKKETIDLLTAADTAVLDLYESQRARYGTNDKHGDLDELLNVHYLISWAMESERKKEKVCD